MCKSAQHNSSLAEFCEDVNLTCRNEIKFLQRLQVYLGKKKPSIFVLLKNMATLLKAYLSDSYSFLYYFNERIKQKVGKELKYAKRNYGMNFKTFHNKLHPSTYFHFALYDKFIKDCSS